MTRLLSSCGGIDSCQQQEFMTKHPDGLWFAVVLLESLMSFIWYGLPPAMHKLQKISIGLATRMRGLL